MEWMDPRRQTDTWKAKGQGSYSQLLYIGVHGQRIERLQRRKFCTIRLQSHDVQQRSIVDEPTANADSLSIAECTDKGLSIAVTIV